MSKISPTLRLAIFPLDITYANPLVNFRNVGMLVEKIAHDVDIIVLPELFSTGFIPDKSKISEHEADVIQARGFVRSLAIENDVAIAGSCLGIENGELINQGFIHLPDCREVSYNKRHLFCLSPEHEIAVSGSTLPPVIEYKGFNLSIIVCYDLRFPVWCRNTGNRYDVMIVPANWPNVRQYAWEHLLKARAIENQSCYIGANRSGEDHYGCYDNSSYIVDERGYSIGNTVDGIVYATLSKENINSYREKLPVWRDADKFTLDL